jgi:hypothetical protein
MPPLRFHYLLYPLAVGAGLALALSDLDRCVVAYAVLAVFLVPLAVTAIVGPWSSEDREPGIWFALLGLILAVALVALLGC